MYELLPAKSTVLLLDWQWTWTTTARRRPSFCLPATSAELKPCVQCISIYKVKLICKRKKNTSRASRFIFSAPAVCECRIGTSQWISGEARVASSGRVDSQKPASHTAATRIGRKTYNMSFVFADTHTNTHAHARGHMESLLGFRSSLFRLALTVNRKTLRASFSTTGIVRKCRISVSASWALLSPCRVGTL